MIKKDIIYFGEPCVLFCDEKCNKAWELNSREKVQVSDDEDDYEFLTDDKLGEAPEDPHLYEDGHAKPCCDNEKLNKWCCRECERSKIVSASEVNDNTDFESLLNDFSIRLKNKRD